MKSDLGLWILQVIFCADLLWQSHSEIKQWILEPQRDLSYILKIYSLGTQEKPFTSARYFTNCLYLVHILYISQTWCFTFIFSGKEFSWTSIDNVLCPCPLEDPSSLSLLLNLAWRFNYISFNLQAQQSRSWSYSALASRHCRDHLQE